MKRIWIVLALAMMAAGLTSCNKELGPTDTILPSNSLSNEGDVTAWRNGFYNAFRQAHGSAWTRPDIQSDMLNLSINVGNRGGDFASWIIKTENSDVTSLYRTYYRRIFNLNFYLNNYKGAKADTDRAKAAVANTAGVAYFCRAFYYFKLAEAWSRLYNPDELCVPLVLKEDITSKEPRATQKVVFAHILSDLENAEKLLKDVAIEASSNDINVAVVKALRARVYLNMKEWAKAAAEAHAVIDLGFGLETNADRFAAIWTHDAPNGEIIMQCFQEYPKEVTASYASFMNFSVANKGYVPDWLPSDFTVSLFQPGDVRTANWIKYDSVLNVSAEYKVYGPMISKYPGNPALQSPDESAQYRNAPKPFRTAEQVLIIAEAEFMAGNEGPARDALNGLRKVRGLAEVSESGSALLDAIREERTRELLCEGFRLWDLRRWGLPCNRETKPRGGILEETPTVLSISKPNDAANFVWPFPSHTIAAGGTLIKQNPGY